MTRKKYFAEFKRRWPWRPSERELNRMMAIDELYQVALVA